MFDPDDILRDLSNKIGPIKNTGATFKKDWFAGASPTAQVTRKILPPRPEVDALGASNQLWSRNYDGDSNSFLFGFF